MADLLVLIIHGLFFRTFMRGVTRGGHDRSRPVAESKKYNRNAWAKNKKE